MHVKENCVWLCVHMCVYIYVYTIWIYNDNNNKTVSILTIRLNIKYKYKHVYFTKKYLYQNIKIILFVKYLFAINIYLFHLK